MSDLKKQLGTSSIIYQALCIISKATVNSNWGDSRDTLNSGKIWRFGDLEIWWMTLKINRSPLLYYSKLCVHCKAIGIFKLELQSGNAQFGSKLEIFVPRDLENWRITLKNNRTPLLYSFKLCASFHSHWCIQTGAKIRRSPYIGQNRRCFYCRVTFKFDGWPWKTIGLIF